MQENQIFWAIGLDRLLLEETPSPPELDAQQLEMVGKAAERLAGLEWTPAAIEAALEATREENGWSRGKFFNPIRATVAGRDTPPIHDTLALLLKEEALARMRRVLR